MAESPDPRWSDIAHHALIDGFLAPAFQQAGAEVVLSSGLVLIKSRVNHDGFNVVFQVSKELSAELAMQRAEAFFGQAGFSVFARDWADQDLKSAALAHGLVVGDDAMPFMIAEGDAGEFETPAELKIVSQPSDQLAVDFAHVGGAVFAEDKAEYEAIQNYLTPSELFSPVAKHFVGYVDGTPVATSCYWMTRGVAAIYWVATLSDFRRRGFAQAMLKTAWKSAFSQGANTVTLQASKAGYPLYLQHGFRDVGTFTKLKRKTQ